MFVAMMKLMMKNCDYNEYQKNVGDNDDNNNNILHCILFSLNFEKKTIHLIVELIELTF